MSIYSVYALGICSFDLISTSDEVAYFFSAHPRCKVDLVSPSHPTELEPGFGQGSNCS